MFATKTTRAILALLAVFSLSAPLVQARTLTGNVQHYSNSTHTYFQRHPYQKTGLIGAGAGAAAGAIFFGDKHHMGRNALRGAAIGGAAGLGYEYLKKHGKL